MASKRVRLNPRTRPMISAPARVQRLALFGPPLLLEGEDEAAYNELLAQFCAAIKPVNVIEEMFVADLLFLEWDILRFRRLKSNLLRASGHEALKEFLDGMLDYESYRETFAEDLAELLQQKVAEEEAEDLARRCARNEPDADEKVNELLVGLRNMDYVFECAKAKKAEELARDFARRKPDAFRQVNELIASSGLTLHDIMAKGFGGTLDDIERIDRLITIAETRRNASLREIDRRRAVLGEAVRRKMQEIEDGQFEVIETMPAEGRTRRDQ
jgi:hypothetical protein